ncbi:hypothetical protein [Vibrio sonorensis]|uniref:hypothetical protein n=1 Tax=Vibrio sonorensis TaxID=1004316 RepID=UPI0008D96195|nr:hypothetical protein [Vibrio sonorensis]
MSSSLQGTAKGDMAATRAIVLEQLSKGDKALTSNFRLKFRNHPDMTFRVSATQIPEMMRHEIESFGHMGTGQNQQGNVKNAGNITVTIEEYLDGKAAKFIGDAIKNKTYYDLDLEITPEDTGYKSIASWEMLKCYLSSEAVDVATEDLTGTIKFPLTIGYNWVEPVKV